MSKINPITSTSYEKMTGTGVHNVEHSSKSCDPTFEHLRIYDRNLPIKKHIPNTLEGVSRVHNELRGVKYVTYYNKEK